MVIYGERGVGKTSLANIISPVLHVFDGPENAEPADVKPSRLVVKVNAHQSDTFAQIWRRALDEVFLDDERAVLGFFPRKAPETQRVALREAWNIPDEPDIDDIRRVLSNLPGSVFIFDEFDCVSQASANPFTDLIKALSDFQTPATIILVGVSETVDGLIQGHASIGRALVQIHVPRMRRSELADILKKAEAKLNVGFDSAAAERIVQMSAGLPHYTHLVGLASVRRACKRFTREVTSEDVEGGLREASNQAEQSLIGELTLATRSAHREALYVPVLLACAITAATSTDELGFFQPSSVVRPLESVLTGRRIEIATFNTHLADFCDNRSGRVLQRTGQQRAFRYRFRNPLLPPYVIMKGLSSKILTMDQLEALLKSDCRPASDGA